MSTTCDRCGRELQQGYAEKHRNGQVVETICLQCNDLEAMQKYQHTGQLSAHLMTLAVLGSYRDTSWARQVEADINRIKAALSDFEREVWYGGLQSYTQNSQARGHSMKTTLVQASLFTTAGRVLLTLSNDKGASVTLITTEDERRRNAMSIQGIDATVGESITMLRLFTDYVRKNGLAFARDNTLSIV